MDIRSDRQKGLSYVELGRKYHMDPRTAKRYAESPQKPEYTLSEPKPTKMDPYKQIVDEWLEEAPYSALRILEKLREMGFDGGYSIVKAYVSSRKMDLNEKATVRFETMPGKQGQMDWGFFEDHLVYEDGKWKKTNVDLVMERQTDVPAWELPEWTKLLTGGIDVQENCLYWTIRAWGDFMTSQNVAHGQALSMAEVERVMNTEFKLPSGEKMMVELALMDSGDQTDEVYNF